MTASLSHAETATCGLNWEEKKKPLYIIRDVRLGRVAVQSENHYHLNAFSREFPTAMKAITLPEMVRNDRATRRSGAKRLRETTDIFLPQEITEGEFETGDEPDREEKTGKTRIGSTLQLIHHERLTK